jgi:thiol-disulfide isomerase/thioredoxin
MAESAVTVEELKTCTYCKETKPVIDFYKNGFRKDGSQIYNSWCKKCRLSLAKVTYREGNKYYSSILTKRSKSYRSFLSYLMSKAKRRTDKEFNLTLNFLDELYQKQEGKCALTGRQLSHIPGDKNTISIDRIDSRKGYTQDNVQLLAKEVNILKWNLTTDELLQFCKEILNHNV